MGIVWRQGQTQLFTEEASLKAAEGCVWIRCDGSVRSGKTVCSDWIDTGLGEGMAMMETAVIDEGGFDTGASGPYLVFGRPDFFENSKFSPSVPDVRVAVSYDTATGRFRLALRFKTAFTKGELGIRWMAFRLERSEAKMASEADEADSMFYITNPPKGLHTGWHYTLKTNVSDASAVEWSVSDGGGEINAAGNYVAPDAAGMYEVRASLKGTDRVTTCFIIVRE